MGLDAGEVMTTSNYYSYSITSQTTTVLPLVIVRWFILLKGFWIPQIEY